MVSLETPPFVERFHGLVVDYAKFVGQLPNFVGDFDGFVGHSLLCWTLSRVGCKLREVGWTVDEVCWRLRWFRWTLPPMLDSFLGWL